MLLLLFVFSLSTPVAFLHMSFIIMSGVQIYQSKFSWTIRDLSNIVHLIQISPPPGRGPYAKGTLIIKLNRYSYSIEY